MIQTRKNTETGVWYVTSSIQFDHRLKN